MELGLVYLVGSPSREFSPRRDGAHRSEKSSRLRPQIGRDKSRVIWIQY